MERFTSDSFLPCKQDAKRMAEIFDRYYYPGKCNPQDIMELRQSYCAQFIVLRDNEKEDLIVGFMVIVPVTDPYFTKFFKGEIYGLGKTPYPREAFPINDVSTDKFIIDCLMTDPDYGRFEVWKDLMLQAVVSLSEIANGTAQIVGETNLKTGHYFYENLLQIPIVKKLPSTVIYKTTLKELTNNVLSFQSASRV
jgi:hypothetical protein